jgi:hypothetical protein
LTIGGDIVRNDNVHWSLDVNLSHNVNKLTELFATKDANGNLVSKPIIAGDGSGIAGSAQRLLQPGLPVDTYYLKEWAGVNVDNGLPMWYRYETDANGNETRTTTSNYSNATFRNVGKGNPDLLAVSVQL